MAAKNYDEVDAAVFSDGSRELPMRQVSPNQPCHPSYEDVASRVQSFQTNWPYNGDQNPCKMAEAGFFFSPSKTDEVWCFYCGARLWNWEPNDIPLVEHVKIAKKQCAFLQKLLGYPKIEEILTSLDLKNADESMKSLKAEGYTKTEVENAMEHFKKTDGINEKTVDEAVETARKGKEGAVNICIKCKKEERQIMFLPCAHTVSCQSCALTTSKCFSCKKCIDEKVRVYMS
ncbi:hypothetical protein ACF0H5_007043 [Mactra antiquata]